MSGKPCHCDRPDCYEPLISEETARKLLDNLKSAVSLLQVSREYSTRDYVQAIQAAEEELNES